MMNTKYAGDFTFYCKWLRISEDYELKVLIMISYLTKSDGKCKQTLANMCRWLGSKPSSATRDKIKATLQSLADQNYLTYENVGNYWVIELIFEDEEWGLFSFKRRWLDQIKMANHDENGRVIDQALSMSWAKVAKVFVYLHMVIADKEVRSSKLCGFDINMSSDLFRKAFKIFDTIDFNDVSLKKKAIRKIINTDEAGKPIFRTLGTQFFIDSPYARNCGSLYSPYLLKAIDEEDLLF